MSVILRKIEFILGWVQGFGYSATLLDKEIRSFKGLIPKARVFVDVGGNIGLYTESILRNFDAAQIHIFEPSAVNTVILEEKFKDLKQVIINPCGLSKTGFSAPLYADWQGSPMASLSKRTLRNYKLDFVPQEEIKLIRFDEYWNETQHSNELIDLFKIDVEGHELDVLRGVGTKINDIKVIQFEFGGANIDSRTFFRDFWDYFKDHDFEMFRITPIGIKIRIKQYHESLERFKISNYICINKKLLS